MTLLRVGILSLILSSAVHAGLIEQAERLVLKNGLEVILIHHPANPVVGITTLVRAGVRNETQASSGASHFLEHLLFNGTKSRTQKQLYDETDFYGIYNNAQTRAGFTLFMMLAGKEHLAKGLNIQADMLFHSTLPKEKFDKERNIVLEEMARYAHRGDHGADAFHRELLYAGTPYRQPVLGTVESLKQISRDAVWKYYRAQYQPGNMTLIVMGDYERPALMKMIEKDYGSVPAGKRPAPAKVGRLNISGRQFISKKNEKLKKNFLTVSFPGPKPGHADFAAVTALTSSLGDRLRKKYSSAGAQHLSLGVEYNRDFSVIRLSAQLDAKSDAAAVAQDILAEVRNESSYHVSNDELKGMLRGLASSEIFLSEKVHYYTFQKAGALIAGGLGFVKGYVPALESVTPFQLADIGRRYFSNANFIGSLTGPNVKDAKVTEFKKASKPTQAAAVAEEVRVIREVLPGGLTVLIRHNPGSSVCGMHLLARNRCYVEPKGRDGIADLMHQLLPKGTHHRSAAAIQNELDDISGNLKVTDSRFIPYDDYYFSREYSYIRLETLDRHMERGVWLLADMIRFPGFPENQVKQVRERTASRLGGKKQGARKAARQAFHKQLFGKHPLTRSVEGTADSVKRITRADLIKFHRKYFAAGNLILTVASGIKPETVMAAVKQSFAGHTGAAAMKKTPRFAKASRPGAHKLPSTGAAQAQIYFGHRVDVPDEDTPAAAMMSAILSDRLVFQLREREGLAYSLGCSFAFTGAGTYFAAGIGTRPKNIEKAIAGIEREIATFLDSEITQKELDRVRNSLVHRRRMRRLTSVNQAYFMGLSEFRGLGTVTEAKLNERLSKLTPDDLRAAARKYLKPARAVVVVAD